MIGPKASSDDWLLVCMRSAFYSINLFVRDCRVVVISSDVFDHFELYQWVFKRSCVKKSVEIPYAEAEDDDLRLYFEQLYSH